MQELKISKQELGSCCAQYGYEELKPSKKDKHYRKGKRKFKKYKNNKKELEKPKYYKNKIKDKNSQNKKKFKREIKCFKCEKNGHITPNCKLKQTIQSLEIDEDIKLK